MSPTAFAEAELRRQQTWKCACGTEQVGSEQCCYCYVRREHGERIGSELKYLRSANAELTTRNRQQSQPTPAELRHGWAGGGQRDPNRRGRADGASCGAEAHDRPDSCGVAVHAIHRPAQPARGRAG